MRRVTVGRTSARFLRQGHPWLRVDRFVRGLEAAATGEPVTLVDEAGTALASALADPGETIGARVYHRRGDRAFDPAAAIDRAWTRRSALHVDPATDCYRVVHGEGDFLPGLRVERYADVLVVLLRCPAIAAHLAPIAERLQHHLPEARIVVREQFDDLRRRPVTTRVWGGGAVDDSETVIGRELGVALPVQPFAGLATGIYVDQRATRAWLREGCAGARVLNLFAYTGLFSHSLLAAGAGRALDVDLAAPALAIGADIAERNGHAERYDQHRGDVRAHLYADQRRWDIVICDPPTAAQGQAGNGWVARRDYPAVLRALAPRLAPGGLLVAISNTVGRPYDLTTAVARALPRARPVETPPLGEDLPQLTGFGEGRPFRLVAVRLS